MVYKNHIRKMDSNKRLENCTFIKTILMLLVLLYHSCVFWRGNWFSVIQPAQKSEILAVFSKWLNSFHIYGFTLVSGYLFFYLKNEKKKYLFFGDFIISKIKRLIIPYVFVCIVWVIPIVVYFYEYDFLEIFHRFILAKSPNQLWFLWMLFGVFVIAYCFNSIIYKKDKLWIIISLALWTVGLFLSKFIPNVFYFETALQFYVFFCIGYKLRQYENYYRINCPIYIWLILDIIAFVIIEFCGCPEVFNIILHTIGAVTSFEVLQKIADSVQWNNNKVFLFLSKISMPIYLFHQQVIYFILFYLNGKVSPYINVVVNFLGSIIISALISIFLMKFGWTRGLIGEK